MEAHGVRALIPKLIVRSLINDLNAFLTRVSGLASANGIDRGPRRW